MRKRFFAAVLSASALVSLSWADIPTNYYDTIDDTNATTLRSTLNDRLTLGHDAVGYNGAWDALEIVDEDPMNTDNVIMIYTGQSRAKADACHVSTCTDGDAFTGLWTREHTWPQSSFDQDEPQRSDLHALFPCDQDLNNTRSNHPYDEVVSPTYTAGGSEDDGTNFEVRPEDRGNIARAMFYMDLRYEGESGEIDLVLNDTPNFGTATGEFGYLSTLIQWHIEDPVDAAEIARNNRVYDQQFNANPFIDHPEWVYVIYNAAPPSDGDTITVSSTDYSTPTALPGEEIEAFGLTLTPTSGEFDLDELTFSQTGTIADAGITEVRLYNDTGADGLDGDETLLDSGALVGGSVTLSANGFRIEGSAVNLLATMQLSGSAMEDDIARLQLDANSITHAISGGTDINPTFADQTSSGTLVTLPVVSNEIVITELMYNSDNSTDETETEWIEIYNSGSAPISLVDATIGDEDATSDPFTVSLDAGEAAVLVPSTISAGDFQAAWGTGFQVIVVTSYPSFANAPSASNEIIALRNSGGVLLDELNYDDSSPWPTDPGGPSISLNSDSLDISSNDNGANWSQSADGVDGAYFATATTIFGSLDVGSPGFVPQPAEAPVVGGVAVSSIVEDDGGLVLVDFTDGNNSDASVFSVEATNPSVGSFSALRTAGAVTKTGTNSYQASFDYNPPADFNGSVTFDFSVDDGGGPVSSNGLTFNVSAVNDAPTISAISAQSTSVNGSVGPIAFTIGDVESLADNLSVDAFSDNPTLLPPGGIVLGGSGANRTITLTPAAGQTGMAMVSVSVEDPQGGLNASIFNLTVDFSSVDGWRDWMNY